MIALKGGSGKTTVATHLALAAHLRGLKTLLVDTAAGAVEDVSEAIVLADAAVMVVRPTLLDIAALARTLAIVRRLRKPSTVVVNQAPVAREGVEAPVVKRALRALEYMRLPIAPVILRSRSVYQTAVETGRSAEEMADQAAASEVAALWDYIDQALLAPAAEEEARGVGADA